MGAIKTANLTIQKLIYRNLVHRKSVNRALERFGTILNKIGIPYATGLTRNKAILFTSTNPEEVQNARDKLLTFERSRALRSINQFGKLSRLYIQTSPEDENCTPIENTKLTEDDKLRIRATYREIIKSDPSLQKWFSLLTVTLPPILESMSEENLKEVVSQGFLKHFKENILTKLIYNPLKESYPSLNEFDSAIVSCTFDPTITDLFGIKIPIISIGFETLKGYKTFLLHSIQSENLLAFVFDVPIDMFLAKTSASTEKSAQETAPIPVIVYCKEQHPRSKRTPEQIKLHESFHCTDPLSRKRLRITEEKKTEDSLIDEMIAVLGEMLDTNNPSDAAMTSMNYWLGFCSRYYQLSLDFIKFLNLPEDLFETLNFSETLSGFSGGGSIPGINRFFIANIFTKRFNELLYQKHHPVNLIEVLIKCESFADLNKKLENFDPEYFSRNTLAEAESTGESSLEDILWIPYI